METILEAFLRNAAAAPSHVAFIHGERQLTFGELALRSSSVAAGLASAGVVRGMPVGILVADGLNFPLAVLALWRLGAIAVPFDPGAPDEDRAARESIAELAFMIVDAPVTLARGSTRQLGIEGLGTAPALPAAGTPQPPEDALYMFTSGTTGQPKALVHTHASLAASMTICVDLGGVVVPGDVVLATVPLQLAIGMRNLVFAPLVVGATVVLVSPFTPRLALQAALRHGATVMVTVPAVVALMASLPESMGRPAFRRVQTSAGNLDAVTYERFHARFGVRAARHYGMSEVGIITLTALRDEPSYRPMVGWPLMETRLLGDDGQEAPPGQPGEVAVRTASLCRPWCLVAGGIREPLPMQDDFFLTGDIGLWEPDGALALAGRKKAFINGPRLRVNPREVEEVLLGMPGVRDAAVVPSPGRHGYDDIHAFIAADREVDEAAVATYCAAHLSAGKRPQIIDFIEGVPRNAAGKVETWRLHSMAPRS